MLDFKRIATLVRFNRYGHRLSPGALAYGESSAPTANVYRWAATGADPNVQQLGALVSRVGPGTGGDAAFSALDPQLERPYVNELTFGFESRPDDRTIVRMIAIVRHEGQLVGVVNTGVPTSSYAAVHADRPGGRSRRRPDGGRVQPAACRVRRGSLSADEPGRASRHVCRRRHHHAKDGRPVVDDRRRPRRGDRR